jgi:hypothetical protein
VELDEANSFVLLPNPFDTKRVALDLKEENQWYRISEATPGFIDKVEKMRLLIMSEARSLSEHFASGNNPTTPTRFESVAQFVGHMSTVWEKTSNASAI